jgi:hypothetical protein
MTVMRIGVLVCTLYGFCVVVHPVSAVTVPTWPGEISCRHCTMCLCHESVCVCVWVWVCVCVMTFCQPVILMQMSAGLTVIDR